MGISSMHLPRPIYPRGKIETGGFIFFSSSNTALLSVGGDPTLQSIIPTHRRSVSLHATPVSVPRYRLCAIGTYWLPVAAKRALIAIIAKVLYLLSRVSVVWVNYTHHRLTLAHQLLRLALS